MASAADCGICLQALVNPFLIPSCNHFFCRACIDAIAANDSGNLLCPICRNVFLIRNLVPYTAPGETASVATPAPVEEPDDGSGLSYCLKLTCKPDSGCKKVHMEDICKTPLPRTEPKAEASVPAEDNRPRFSLPKDATYCGCITCPGGPKSKCGKVHECDIFKVSKAA